ncbi:MAG: DUF2865 domain-containing protein [Rhizobiales bacterium]|nr:DUF2865 domain-containing protein [Hyphomicrobiales bacterium]
MGHVMSSDAYGAGRIFDRFAGAFSLLVAGLLVVAMPTFVFLLVNDASESAARTSRSSDAEVYRGSVLFTADDWNSFTTAIRDEGYWTRRRPAGGQGGGSGAEQPLLQPAGLTSANGGSASAWQPGTRNSGRVPQSEYGTYRTVCVRLCDGYFWPISFTTGRGNFRADEQACASSCAAETKLFYYANPGQEPEDMVDLRGRPYSKLRTAFQYARQQVPSCKCRPDPWEAAAQQRHARFAQMERDGTMKKYLAQLERKADRARAQRVQVVSFGGGISAPSSSRTVVAGGEQSGDSRYVRSVNRMGLGATSRVVVVTPSSRAPQASVSRGVARKSAFSSAEQR